MAPYILPTPTVARPLPPIDPYRHREAYARVLSTLFHAEAAALEGFRLLTDPSFVQSNDLFAKASRKLVEDEAKHLDDIKQLVLKLGFDDVLPPSRAEAEFWTAWRSGKLFSLPFKPSVASLFCLFSEGLGYAFLYNLAQATTDPEIREVLWNNVEDEKAHLRLSLTILKRALVNDKTFLADFLIYLYGYSLVARQPTREQRRVLEAVGLDFDVVVGSSIRFVFDLLKLILAETGRDSPMWALLDRGTALLGERPEAVRLLYLSMFLPEPVLGRQLVYGWGQITRRIGAPLAQVLPIRKGIAVPSSASPSRRVQA